MTRQSEPSHQFRLSQTGGPQLVTVSYRGLQYRGEVVSSERWDPALGQPLEGDLYFRIVALMNPRGVPAGDIQDSRIAVCVPGRGASRRRGQTDRGLAALRETQALYVTRGDPENAPICSYLDRQRLELEAQMIREEAARYAGGHIESTAAMGDTGGFFASPEPVSWFTEIGQAVLAAAYPGLPIDPSMFPRSITAEDVAATYRAIFARASEDRIPLGEFGPGLGLTSLQDPLTVAPGKSMPFRQIRTALEDHGGDLSWDRIHPLLAHRTGLTGPLASLFLLAFVYYGEPRIELALADGHGLTLGYGAPVRGERLAREFVPYLPWREDGFSGKFVGGRQPVGELTWNNALQYTSMLAQGLTELSEGSPELHLQEEELLEALTYLRRKADSVREALERLAVVMPGPRVQASLAQVSRLSQVFGGTDFQGVHALAPSTYPDPRNLIEDLEKLTLLIYLAGQVEDMAGARAYLDGSSIQAGHPELSLVRMALLEELSSDVILGGGQGWPPVRAHVQDYRTRYGQAYGVHHESYHSRVSDLRMALEDAEISLRALSILNTIQEMGEPVGADLDQVYSDLRHSVVPCTMSLEEMVIRSNPRCPGCRIELGEVPLSQEVNAFLKDLDRSLGEQNRRLSLALVERILHDRVDERLDSFLKIVQASDLRALSNTLNEELGLFIRQLLRDS